MLVQYAKDELQRAAIFDKDADYDGQIAPCVIELMEVFSKQGHTGFSAALTLDLFTRLARFTPLTPLSSNLDEWIDRTEESDGNPMWQSKRSPSTFSKDGGKTWYDLDDPKP